MDIACHQCIDRRLLDMQWRIGMGAAKLHVDEVTGIRSECRRPGIHAKRFAGTFGDASGKADHESISPVVFRLSPAPQRVSKPAFREPGQLA
ncbi:hypothetical protein D3C80_1879180 [compost metagenome]